MAVHVVTQARIVDSLVTQLGLVGDGAHDFLDVGLGSAFVVTQVFASQEVVLVGVHDDFAQAVLLFGFIDRHGASVNSGNDFLQRIGLGRNARFFFELCIFLALLRNRTLDLNRVNDAHSAISFSTSSAMSKSPR